MDWIIAIVIFVSKGFCGLDYSNWIIVIAMAKQLIESHL